MKIIPSTICKSRSLVVGIIHSKACLQKLAKEKSDLKTARIDLLEVRLDGLLHCSLIPKNWPLPIIATARNPKEGGLNNLSLIQRKHLLESALSWATIIDVELESVNNLTPVITRAREAQRPLIFSYHNFKKTPSLEELQDLVARAHDAGATIFKVATMTQCEEELEQLLAFQQLSHPLPVATMGMGSLGKKSRPLLAAAGSVLLYGYLYEPLSYALASTQWSARELAKRRKNN